MWTEISQIAAPSDQESLAQAPLEDASGLGQDVAWRSPGLVLADFAAEPPVRRRSRYGKAHLDTYDVVPPRCSSSAGRPRCFWIKARHGGKGTGRRWPISRIILVSGVRDMATSAS